MARTMQNIYSRSNISISYSVKENLSLLAQMYPGTVTDCLKVVADEALSQTRSMTPYSPANKNSTQHLRDSAKVQVYQNGRLGGTCYVQWQAKNPRSGYHYGIAQEAGGTVNPPISYENYSTPGTGPGFMTQTWTIMQQLAPQYIADSTSKLLKELSVK